MLVYHYDSDSGEFDSSSEAQESPLEFDVFFVPAGATTTPPPIAHEGLKAAWTGVQWVLKNDRRGEAYYLPDGTAGVVTDLGAEPPAESTPDMPVGPYRRLKLSAIDALAGAARLRFITDLPGQPQVYAAKLEQALQCRDMGGTPPMIYAEMRAAGLSATDAAQRILDANARWRVACVIIEAARIGAKVAISAAASVVEIDAIVASARDRLDAVA